jgi:hypothetical protein
MTSRKWVSWYQGDHLNGFYAVMDTALTCQWHIGNQKKLTFCIFIYLASRIPIISANFDFNINTEKMFLLGA